MTRRRRSLARWLSPLALATGLVLGLATSPARAQPPAAPDEAATKEESGRSFDGYAATAVLAGLALFVVAKSARR
jgi:hypothetical protein